jgi:hypothetical protein
MLALRRITREAVAVSEPLEDTLAVRSIAGTTRVAVAVKVLEEATDEVLSKTIGSTGQTANVHETHCSEALVNVPGSRLAALKAR